MMGEDGSDVFLSDPGVTLRKEDRSARDGLTGQGKYSSRTRLISLTIGGRLT